MNELTNDELESVSGGMFIDCDDWRNWRDCPYQSPPIILPPPTI